MNRKRSSWQAALCKLQLQAASTRRQHFLPSHSGYCLNQSLRESSFPRWKLRVECAPHKGLRASHYFLPLVLNTKLCQNSILRVLACGVNHCEMADWSWEPHPQDMRRPGYVFKLFQSMGSPRVGHDWATSLSLFTFMHWRRKWQLTPVFLPGESQGRRSLVGCRLWGHTESDTTEVT